MRIGQGDDLARVRGIGEDLLVTGHGGVEHHFADGEAGRADGFALEHGAVFEREDCGLGHGGFAYVGLQKTAGTVRDRPEAKESGERE